MKTAIRLAWVFFLLLCIVAGAFYYDPLWVRDEQTRYRLWREGAHSRYVVAGGHRLHYYEAIPTGGGGAPLLLIHGLGDHAESWAAQIPALTAAGFHVYAPDLLGYGRSDKPGLTYGIPAEETSIIHFMHSVGLTHANIAGWSMGGWIAAKLALDRPGMVDRLVLEDSAGLRPIVNIPSELFVPTDKAGLDRLLEMLSPHPPAMPDFVARAALRRLAEGAPVVRSSMAEMESGADLLDSRLAGVTQPTLIVWGSEDRLLPIETGRQMHRDIPHSVFATITGCGHLAPSECAGPVAQVTIQFLKASPPPPRGEKVVSGTASTQSRTDLKPSR